MDRKFYCDGEILIHAKLYKKSFISLVCDNEKYIIIGNSKGLKSFNDTLKLFSKKKNGFLFLDDIDMDGHYCYHTDFFFDAPSIRMDFIKVIETCQNIILYEYVYPINNKAGIGLYVSLSNLKKMIKKIKFLMKNKDCLNIEIDVVTEDNNVKKLIVCKTDKESIKN